MSWTNYHSHCNYCDGKGELEEYAEEAFSKGFVAYGYSSHAPLPFDCEWCMQISDLDEYLGHVERLKLKWRGQMQIYAGLEVDFIPEKIGPGSPFLKALNLDYTIGSIHFIDTFEDGTPWEIDGLHTVFQKGFEEIFDQDIEAVIRRYFELTRMMVQNDCPDVVGHLDKIKIQNPGNKYYNENEPWYQEEIVKTLEAISQANVIVEVNTRGLYKKVAELYPSIWVLTKMHDMNIPIMLNSDSHHIREIDGNFEQAAKTLLEIGYDHLHIYLHDKWQAVPFTENGINVTIDAQ